MTVLFRQTDEKKKALRDAYLSFLLWVNPLAQRGRAEKVALHRLVKLVDVALDEKKCTKYRYYVQLVSWMDFPTCVEDVEPEIVFPSSPREKETLHALSWVSWKYPVNSGRAEILSYLLRDRISGAYIGIVIGALPPMYGGGRLHILPELSGRNGTGARVVNRFLWLRRIGALEPFSYFLGGKLLTLSLFAEEVQRKYEERHGRKYIAVELTNLFGSSPVYHRLRLPDGRKAVYGKSYTEGHGDILVRISSLFQASGKLQKLDRIPELKPYLRHGFRREYLILSLTEGDLQKEMFSYSPKTISYPWEEIVGWWKRKYFQKRAGKPYTGKTLRERAQKDLEIIERLRRVRKSADLFRVELGKAFWELVGEEVTLLWEVER